jgi:hypothetical protein
MTRREPSPLLGASEPGDLADVARRDLMVSMAHGNSWPRAASFINWPLSGTLRRNGRGRCRPCDEPVMHGARPLYGKAPQNGAFL